MSNLTEAQALENGCCCRCECGQFHGSIFKAIACEGCRELLTADEYGIRRITALGSREILWEGPVARFEAAEEAEREAREAAEDEAAAKAAVHPAPLTYNPFAALS